MTRSISLALLLFVLGNEKGYTQISALEKTTGKIAGLYFRSNPFDKGFKIFLNQLLNDPALLNKTELKRTDSSLFYVSGEYKHYNPFFFITSRTKVVLAEAEFTVNDSLQQVDTIFTYQLAGYVKTSDNGEKDVVTEFEKFDRKYRNKFQDNDYTELKKGEIIYGAVKNYFDKKHALAPLSIGWQRITNPDECVFVITIRFRVFENIAYFPSYIILD